MDQSKDAPLVSEADDRYDLIGFEVVDRSGDEPGTFRAFSRDEVDMPGYVEHAEAQYAGTRWSTVRVWRSRTRPSDLADCVAAARDYVGLVEKVHRAYGSIVMDTEDERAVHARHVQVADDALSLAKSKLDSIGQTL